MIGHDGIVHQAISTLRAQLPAAVDALNGHPGAPQLEHIPHDRYYPFGERKPRSYPAVEVACPGLRVGALDIPNFHGDATAEVYVLVRCEGRPGGAFGAIAAQASRYTQAILSIIAQHDACGLGSSMISADVRVGRPADLPDTDPDAGRGGGAGTRYVNGLVIALIGWSDALAVA